jgi:hypothetical protein
MKHQEVYTGSMDEFRGWFTSTIQSLFTNKLMVEGKNVILPTDRQLDYKVKFDDDTDGQSFSFKISWDKEIEQEE